MLYEKKGIEEGCFNWLIPRFAGGSKWFEVVVFNLHDFFDLYFRDIEFDDFAVADLNNGIVFDIENGENEINYYVKLI